MKQPVSMLIFVLAIIIFSSKQVENLSKNAKLSLYMMRTYGWITSHRQKFNDLIDRELQKKTLKFQEKKRQEEENKTRKVINEHLMPLTKGNGFMRDFYSGRY